MPITKELIADYVAGRLDSAMERLVKGTAAKEPVVARQIMQAFETQQRVHRKLAG